MLIICLIGQKRVGKDTVASIINKYDENFVMLALATPIKEIARVMFNFSLKQLYDSEKDEIDSRYGIKPRDFFEQFGTQIMQYDIYKYLPALEEKIPQRLFWVRNLINTIDTIKTQNATNNKKCNQNKFIITDIRGLHELEEIKKYENNIFCIKIIRPDINITTTDNLSQDTQIEQHITQIEPGLIPDTHIDEVIINNGSIDELESKIVKILAKLYSKKLI